MMSVASILVRGLQLEPRKGLIVPLDQPVHCAICGRPIEGGARVMDAITPNTTEYLDQFRGHMHGYLCEDAVACYRPAGDGLWRALMRTCLVFEDGTYFWPLISRETADADAERPCWSDLVRDVWPEREGQRMVMILTNDQRKRLWPRARVGVLGPATDIYLYDSGVGHDGVRRINWERLLDQLDLVERIYAAGFAKRPIEANLLEHYKAAEEVGWLQTVAWERELSEIRATSEFSVALTIAQKQGES